VENRSAKAFGSIAGFAVADERYERRVNPKLIASMSAPTITWVVVRNATASIGSRNSVVNFTK
jgi:hypothetical protein